MNLKRQKNTELPPVRWKFASLVRCLGGKAKVNLPADEEPVIRLSCAESSVHPLEDDPFATPLDDDETG